MIEILVKALSSLLSPERIVQYKRASVAKSLSKLHRLIHDIIEIGEHFTSSDYDDDDLSYWIPISMIEAHHQRLSEVYSLLRSSPVCEILNIHVPDYRDVYGLITRKSKSIRFLLASVYGFVDEKVAEADINNIWKVRQFDNPEFPEYIWEYKRPEYTDISLTEALKFKEAYNYDIKIAVYATPRHIQKTVAVLEQLKAVNESLRKFISSEFKPEELL